MPTYSWYPTFVSDGEQRAEAESRTSPNPTFLLGLMSENHHQQPSNRIHRSRFWPGGNASTWLGWKPTWV